MAEKSPTVQPIRHRVVLTDALFHTALELQNSVEVIDTGAGVFGLFFLLQHWLLVHCFWRLVARDRPVTGVARRGPIAAGRRAQRRNEMQIARILGLFPLYVGINLLMRGNM